MPLGVACGKQDKKITNTFCTFADKEEVDYSQKEKHFSKTEFAKKLWNRQLKNYKGMEL